MRVIPLSAAPHLAPKAADLVHETWGGLTTFRDRNAIHRNYANRIDGHAAPFTFVTVDANGDLVATASVLLHEIPLPAHRIHWLGEVIVLPSYRGRGVGTALVESVVLHAARIGITELYLYTPDQQALYERLGWRTIDRDVVGNEDVDIMARTIPALPAN
jgi:N-acetylglutamate synthase-like GNAT family acetyltransferase